MSKYSILTSTFKTTLAAATALSTFGLGSATAGTNDYIGEIFMFAGSFCPYGSLKANGQQITMSHEPALYSILGNHYGGDGRVYFNLPDLRGRSAIGWGQGLGMVYHPIGVGGGVEERVLTTAHMPSHHHVIPDHTHDGVVNASSSTPDTNSPAGSSLASYPSNNAYVAGPPDGEFMATGTVEVTPDGPGITNNAGSDVPVNIRDPYLPISFCIVTIGTYPPLN